MIPPYLLTDMMARQGTAQRWRIPHNSTHLSITILLPDTDQPNVMWVLPDGQRIEGNVLDADVPAGETLCLCDDFARCGIDMTGNNPHALHLNAAEMPVTRGRRIGIPGRCGMYRDARYNSPTSVQASDGTLRATSVGKIRIIGSEMVFSVEDINQRKASLGRDTHIHLEIAHSPYFTGNLADLNTKTQYFYRVPNADFTGYLPINPAQGNQVYVMQHTIIHHTGVHGHCDFSTASPGHFGFYGNPNMTPDDYDQTVIALAQTLSANSSSNSMFLFDPDDFILDISNRRTSASDEAVATLRELGMVVNEIED